METQKARKIAEGMTLLVSYEGSAVAVGHDQLWAGPHAGRVSDGDAQRLRALGWFLDNETDSWSVFV